MPRGMNRFGGTRVAGWELEPGFATVAGPFGVQPLRNERDSGLANAALELGIPIAIASMSADYLESVLRNVNWAKQGIAPEYDGIHAEERLASHGGLTVRWPTQGEMGWRSDLTEDV